MVLKPPPAPVRPSFTAATLVGLIRAALCRLPDRRKGGNNPRYAMGDAGLSAFSVFFLQSPSFLDYQRRMQKERGRNNASSLFGVHQNSEHLADRQSARPGRAGSGGGVPVAAGARPAPGRAGQTGLRAQRRYPLALASLTLLAFLAHTVLNRLDLRYQAVRRHSPSRRTFFEHLRALAQYLPFDPWYHLFSFMLEALEPAQPPPARRPSARRRQI